MRNEENDLPKVTFGLRLMREGEHIRIEVTYKVLKDIEVLIRREALEGLSQDSKKEDANKEYVEQFNSHRDNILKKVADKLDKTENPELILLTREDFIET